MVFTHTASGAGPCAKSSATPPSAPTSRAAPAWELRRSGAAIARVIEAEGCELLAEHVEVETGKGADAIDRRPELGRALATARKARGAVLVAKLVV